MMSMDQLESYTNSKFPWVGPARRDRSEGADGMSLSPAQAVGDTLQVSPPLQPEICAVNSK